MSIPHPFKRSVVAVSAALSLMAIAPSSEAGVVGTFDPTFGGTNPQLANVGFQGTFDLNVASSCYATTGYVSTGNGCTITVNSITVGFYNTVDYVDSGATTPTIIQSYTLDPTTSTFAVPNEENYITGAYFDPTTDRLVGFDTEDSNFFGVNINQCPQGTGSCSSRSPITYSGSMLLYFVSGYHPEEEISRESTTVPSGRSGLPGAFLVDCSNADGSDCSSSTDDNSNGAIVQVTSDPGPLPEPETIPLTLIGLAALAVTGWRRRYVSTGGRRRVD